MGSLAFGSRVCFAYLTTGECYAPHYMTPHTREVVCALITIIMSAWSDLWEWSSSDRLNEIDWF